MNFAFPDIKICLLFSLILTFVPACDKMAYINLKEKKVTVLKTSDRKGSFLQGAFILTISTAFVKLAGLLFTIPIANMLGGDGMGYFYAAYDI